MINQFRHGTIKEWETKNPILLEGEIGVVIGLNEIGDNLEDKTQKAKIGDGIHPWNELEWWSLIQSDGPDNDILVDQTYNPESENAQSGKALEPIFDSKPTIFSGTDLNGEMPNGILSTMNTELITAKIGDLYVNIETQCLYGCIKEYDGHYTDWVALNKCTSDVYDSQSSMAMSGIAVGEAINNAIGDIDAALDAIIALQNSIIGGE